MNNITEEIEGSQMGEALAADSKASPYSVTKLRDIISDIKTERHHQRHQTTSQPILQITNCLLGYEGDVCRFSDHITEANQ